MTKKEMVEELMEHQLYLASLDGAYLRDWFRHYFNTMDPVKFVAEWDEMLNDKEDGLGQP
jgi:hypothetical protein